VTGKEPKFFQKSSKNRKVGEILKVWGIREGKKNRKNMKGG